MKASALGRLVRLSLARDLRGAFFSAFGVAIGVGSLVFFVALGIGVDRVIREKIFPLDSRLVDVVPSAVSLGSLLGGGKLDAATVERLEQLPEVARGLPEDERAGAGGDPLRRRLLRLAAADGRGDARRRRRPGAVRDRRARGRLRRPGAGQAGAGDRLDPGARDLQQELRPGARAAPALALAARRVHLPGRVQPLVRRPDRARPVDRGAAPGRRALGPRAARRRHGAARDRDPDRTAPPGSTPRPTPRSPSRRRTRPGSRRSPRR